jgi:hypothetical protein
LKFDFAFLAAHGEMRVNVVIDRKSGEILSRYFGAWTNRVLRGGFEQSCRAVNTDKSALMGLSRPRNIVYMFAQNP